MRSLGKTVARLAAMRRAAQTADSGLPSRLSPLTGFGSNPGALKGFVYLPQSLRPGAPLVVVLHGCTQSAAGYDHGSGWSQLADRLGFALLFPEQQRSNNPHLCFNWFAPEDARRGRGEALSIRQMVESMVVGHSIDRSRIFVTGLSAGGAMAAVMLASYPDVFAGGAVIAGLPFGDANSVPEAFERMRGQGGANHAELAAAVRSASAHRGPWPKLSVWHGTGDHTVDPSNADALIGQWRELAGLPDAPSSSSRIGTALHEEWRGEDGRVLIERYTVPGLGHGTPLQTRGPEALGAAGPHMLEAGINSTRRIAEFWGVAAQAKTAPANDAQPTVLHAAPAASGTTRPAADATTRSADVDAIIKNALRQAGLMR